MQKRTWPISSHQDGFFRRVKHNLKASKERQTHGTPRLLCDCLHSPKKHEKITPNKLRFPSRIMSELQDYSAALPTSGDLKSGDSLFWTTPPPPPSPNFNSPNTQRVQKSILSGRFGDPYGSYCTWIIQKT